MYFNNINFCDYLIVNDIRRSILPPQNTILRKVPKSIGQTFIRKELGVGVIEVDITLIANNRVNLRKNIRQLASMLYTETLEKLIFDDEVDKYYMAILSEDTELEEICSIGEGTLTFICPDPISYGDTKSHTITDSVKLFLSGTYKTKPKFIFNINSNIDHIKLTHIDKGKFVYIEHNFIPGDIVEVDFNDKWKVRKNGVVIAEDIWIISDFFYLDVGENNINIEPLGVDVTMEYIERWL
ncbi:distal tail protein Dit [Senegalia massiliensis]|uniref:distal tail protein Dit n=1 Tax=Senegalia massiliensis TaxID=1720316 RepID=UPI0010306225|nr:distal tail protein Dit [Senegalia massiliensis]